MMNQVIFVGRLTEDPTVVENEKGKQRAVITLAVPRSYKNADGIYETDFIPCILWDGIATNTSEYCKKGDIVGVKGRIQSLDGNVEIVAEKVTFLSTKKSDNE
ncbi:MAG: single-stranded DNA-binding protein [Clostridia bacterium]|nr:single-stranded DNA-binding protein [Clostridia bacterium]